MVSIVVPWLVIAALLIIAGATLVVAGIKAPLARFWQWVLGVIGVATIGAGLYWGLFLFGRVNP